MIDPKPGFPFGPPQHRNGRVVRTPASRHVARQAVGRISFAGRDVESTPSIESAIGSGLRTAREVPAATRRPGRDEPFHEDHDQGQGWRQFVSGQRLRHRPLRAA